MIHEHIQYIYIYKHQRKVSECDTFPAKSRVVKVEVHKRNASEDVSKCRRFIRENCKGLDINAYLNDKGCERSITADEIWQTVSNCRTERVRVRMVSVAILIAKLWF